MQKVKHSYHLTQQFHSQVHKTTESLRPHGDLYVNVYSHIIHNNQKVKTTQIFTYQITGLL